MRYHIVRITIERYIRLYSFDADALEEAMKIAVDRRWSTPSSAHVLRDGHTGRRYSVAECKERLGMGSFDTLDNLGGLV